MLWFDLVTPKCVLFFKELIEHFKAWGVPVLVTAREGVDYKEVVALLKLHEIDFIQVGEFGGGNLKDKFVASLKRQEELLKIVEEHNVTRLISLCSVDANRVAFGLGIPIINFYDIPLSDCKMDLKKALPQARLTIPLSTQIFHPYLIPKEIFLRFGLEEEQVKSYNFYDVFIWLHDFKVDKEFVEDFYRKNQLDKSKPLILIREEEFKSSYVKKKYPLLYEGLNRLHKVFDANYVIIPRYDSEPLKEKFPFATVIDEKIHVQHLMAVADLFIGGGGTMNAESCFFGTPTISTRSFISHYDKALIEAGLMEHVRTIDELIYKAKKLVGKRFNDKANEFFGKMKVDIEKLAEEILSV